MSTFFRRVAYLCLRIVDKPIFWLVSGYLKLVEYPSVRAEAKPRFLTMETISPATGATYAIVVKFFGRGLDETFLSLLETLRRENVNTILVFNGRPDQASRHLVEDLVHRIVVRKNVGRDFGAYRAAFLLLTQEGIQPERLLFFNDSIIYLPGRALTQLVESLKTSPSQVVGSFENHSRSHHVGSYAFSIDRTTFLDPKVRYFWQHYWPSNLRVHAIKRGELKLSRVYREARLRLDVVYSLDKLAAKLEALTFSEILELASYMPLEFRNTILRALDIPVRVAALLGLGKTDSTNHSSVLEVDTLSQDSDAVRLLAKRALIDHLLERIADQSQIHFGFGLYHRLLDAPLVKKDLLYHGLYAEQDIATILSDVEPKLRTSIIRDLISRQRPIHLGLVDGFVRRNGF